MMSITPSDYRAWRMSGKLYPLSGFLLSSGKVSVEYLSLSLSRMQMFCVRMYYVSCRFLFCVSVRWGSTTFAKHGRSGKTAGSRGAQRFFFFFGAALCCSFSGFTDIWCTTVAQFTDLSSFHRSGSRSACQSGSRVWLRMRVTSP